MFYFDESKITYPRKGILEDAIKRNTIDEDSYSPVIDEVYNALMRYKDYDAFSQFPIDKFPRSASNYKDYSLSKMMERNERSMSEMNDEPTRAEIISLDNNVIKSIVDYASNILYGWFHKNKDGAISKKNDYKLEAYVAMKDNSDSDVMMSPSDLIEDDREEELEYKDKIYLVGRLTYYLRLMQECSIAKSMNMLQIVFAEARHGPNASTIVMEGIAKIGSMGEVLDIYGTSHNTSKTWNEMWKWYMSKERDMWGKIVDEFKSICAELKIDLKNEKYTDFPPSVVNKLLSIYLASNEEWLDTVGRCDMTVYGMLDPSRLLQVRSSVPGFKQDWIFTASEFKFIQTYIAKFELIQLDVERLEYKWVNGVDDSEFAYSIFTENHEEDVRELMNILKYALNIQKSIDEFMRPFYYNDYNVLCDNSGLEEIPVSISRSTMCNVLGFRDAPDKVCFTISGLAISEVNGSNNQFRYSSVKELISLIKGGVNNAYPSGQIGYI